MRSEGHEGVSHRQGKASPCRKTLGVCLTFWGVREVVEVGGATVADQSN